MFRFISIENISVQFSANTMGPYKGILVLNRA